MTLQELLTEVGSISADTPWVRGAIMAGSFMANLATVGGFLLRRKKPQRVRVSADIPEGQNVSITTSTSTGGKGA